MARKRTSLDTILAPRPTKPSAAPAPEPVVAPQVEGKRPGVKQQTVYLPLRVHEQLRRLAFEEQARMHDYLLEGLDLVFLQRGLPSITELTGRTLQSREP